MLRNHAIEIMERCYDISHLLPNSLLPEVISCFTIGLQGVL